MGMKRPFVTRERLEAIAAEHPTPFYLYDEAEIRRRAAELNAAFSWNPGFREYFAVKATPNPWIVSVLAECGCGCDCATGPELMLAEAAGVTGRRVMLSSSAQASLEGRYAGSAYGESKLAGEGLFREYSERTGAPVYVYRFPNLYGKWCRPRYNSVVATFCDAIANGREFRVSDPSVELELLHIDDLVSCMLELLLGNVAPGPDGLCHAGPTDRATLGEIVALLESFRDSRSDLSVPDQTDGGFSKKLHATFLSYYDRGSLAYPLRANRDGRGSFTELLRTPDRGQVSVNVSGPGVTKGNHWHHQKWEKFLVVSGEALIRLRRVGVDAEGNPYPVDEYRVSGEEPVVVEMAPGMTHNIKNLADEEDLVTVMWASEPFDPERPDTYFEEV